MQCDLRVGTLVSAAGADISEVDIMVQAVQRPFASQPETKHLPLLY